jgi:uncharacterized membrane-anchored protein
MTRRRVVALAVALAVQLALLAAGAGPRLIVRVTGTEYRLAVEPVDPIDPLRGAYVDLRLSGLPGSGERDGTVFVALRPADGGGGLLRAGDVVAEAPADGPYLRCEAGGSVSCGIESFFASQGEARRLGARVGGRGGVARVKVGLGGRAVLVGLE